MISFHSVKWYHITSRVPFLFTALSHWYPHIICNKFLNHIVKRYDESFTLVHYLEASCPCIWNILRTQALLVCVWTRNIAVPRPMASIKILILVMDSSNVATEKFKEPSVLKERCTTTNTRNAVAKEKQRVTSQEEYEVSLAFSYSVINFFNCDTCCR